MKEADVPGRKPNVAERAGITEDYILTHIKSVKGTLPAGAAEAKPGTPMGIAGYTRATMFEVIGIDDEQLNETRRSSCANRGDLRERRSAASQARNADSNGRSRRDPRDRDSPGLGGVSTEVG